MPVGPGKYDDLATHARSKSGARGVVLIVIGGNRGDGFSVQADALITFNLPQLLRKVADDVERSLRDDGYDPTRREYPQ